MEPDASGGGPARVSSTTSSAPPRGESPISDRAAVVAHDPVNDGEAETGAAGLRREVGLEDALALHVGHARAVVADANHDAIAPLARLDGHDHAAAAAGVLGRSGLARVLHEVLEHLRQLVAVREHLGDRRSVLELDLDAATLVERDDAVREVEDVELDRLGTRHPRELAELGDDAPQTLDLFEDRDGRLLEDLVEVRVLLLVRFSHRLDRDLDGRERVLDLVRDSARDVPPGRDPLGAEEPPLRALELSCHRVERLERAADVTSRLHSDRRFEIAGGDAAGRVLELGERPRQPEGEHETDGQRERERDAATDQETAIELGELRQKRAVVERRVERENRLAVGSGERLHRAARARDIARRGLRVDETQLHVLRARRDAVDEARVEEPPTDHADVDLVPRDDARREERARIVSLSSIAEPHRVNERRPVGADRGRDQLGIASARTASIVPRREHRVALPRTHVDQLERVEAEAPHERRKELHAARPGARDRTFPPRD